MKQISVVIPIYNEMHCLPTLMQALVQVCKCSPQYAWRFVLVDDGSDDGSLAYLQQQAEQNATVVCVELSRNFGHQMAIAAGLAQSADADATIMLDGDMQDPPRIMASMLSCYEQGDDVVLARRVDRAERGWRRLGMAFFHRFLIRLCDFPLLPNVGIYSLLSKPVVRQLNALQECNRYLPAMRAWVGYQVGMVDYVRDQRFAGKPKQRFRDLLKEAMNCIFSFSNLPLRLITWVGGGITVLGLLMGVFFVCKRLFFYDPAVTGFTTLLTTMLFFGGVQLLCLGVVGQYVARIHAQSLGRPLYIIKKIHQQQSERDQQPSLDQVEFIG